MIRIAEVNNTRLHWRQDGDPNGKPLIFANSLGTDLRLWDQVLPLLPAGYRIIRFDVRGHGLSDCPAGPYRMEGLTRDTEALLEHLQVKNAVFVGLSIGGMIGLGLASARPDLVGALVVSNSAAQMGDPDMWQARMAAIREGGIQAIAEAVLDRWFAEAFRHHPDARAWRNMLVRTPKEGYLGCCAAIAEADLRGAARAIRLPALAIAGSQDQACPPLKTQATAAMIPGCAFEMIEDTGHLPCVENPAEYAAILNRFLQGLPE